MALKDKTSLYDLVGDGPVGNMLTQQGAPFDSGLDSEFHAGPDGPNPNPTSLIDVYSKTIAENFTFLAPQDGNPVDQDLNGLPGPLFDLGMNSEIHAGPDGPNPNPTSLIEVYNNALNVDSPFLAPQSGNPVDQDLDGLPGPLFDLGLNSVFHAGPDGPNPTGTSLIEVYTKTIAGNFTFNAPQSGNPVDQDLDGGFPALGRYQDNLPEGGYF